MCNCYFDRDIIQAVKHNGNRYSHASCEPDNKNFVPLVEKNIKKRELEELKAYIKDLLGETYSPQKVTRQLKEFVDKNNYTYVGIKKSLEWFYRVQGNPIEKANGGIGIVPYIYLQAREYYNNLYIAQLSNIDKNIEEYNIKEEKVKIKRPSIQKEKPKLFNLEGNNEEE